MDPHRFMAGLVLTPHSDVLQSCLRRLPHMIDNHQAQVALTLAKAVRPQIFRASIHNNLSIKSTQLH